MKNYRRLLAVVCVLLIAIIAGVNIGLYRNFLQDDTRPYMVEVFRIAEEMREAAGIVDISSCKYVQKVTLCETEEDITKSSSYDVCIREIDGRLYRFEYVTETFKNKNVYICVNAALLGVAILVMGILIYVYRRIIMPFHQMEKVPYELSKGNLALELPEERTRFFGKFIWGTNMLRENLEEQRQRELAMHRDKKLLLLSLTHDIKTPLSVIKLNAQALSKGLYKEETKKQQVAEEINGKVQEIEQYVTEIIAASRDDFMDLSVKEEDVYLSQIVEKISGFYATKLERNKTTFTIGDYEECLLHGDESRINEVLQNLIENAIKYGDGEQLRLIFSREEDCQLITVANTGERMNPNEIIKVFDSFYRGSNVGNQSGNGLGLYICRQLMTNMNGDIFVKQLENEFQVTIVIPMS